MRTFFLILILAIAMVNGRVCRYFMGECVEECVENSHIYASSCSSPTWSERTCEEPEKRDLGPICDLVRCECDEPLVKNKATGKCIKLEDCPKKVDT